MNMKDFNVWMRTRAKIFFFVICVILMVTWFTPIDRLFARDKNIAGRIFNKDVSAHEVASIEQTLWAISGHQTERTSGGAWEALILQEEARRYGISVGDEALANFLRTNFPSLTDPKSYDPQTYRSFLDTARINEKDFQDALKVLLAGERLRLAVMNSVTVPDSEAWLLYCHISEKVKADYIELAARRCAQLVQVDDAALKDFYEQHKQIPPEKAPNHVGYLQPEQVKIEYVLCPSAPFTEQAVITGQQVQTYYDEHKSDYPASAAAAGPLQPESGAQPLSEVSEQIEKQLRAEEASRAVDEVMKEVGDEISRQTEVPFGSTEIRTADLAAIAEKFGLVHQVTGYFSADKVETTLPGANDLASRAFGQAAFRIGETSISLPAKDGDYIFKVVPPVIDPRPAIFEDKDVHQRVEADYRTQKGYELAVELAKLGKGADNLDAAAAKIEAAVAERLKALQPSASPEEIARMPDPKSFFFRGQTDFFARTAEISTPYQVIRIRNIKGMALDANYANFADAAFAVKDGEVGVAFEPAVEPQGPHAAYCLLRTAVQQPERRVFEVDKENLVRDFLQTKQTAILEDWYADLRRRANPSQEVVKALASLPLWRARAQ